MNTSPPGFPPALVDRVTRFLSEGQTGLIELQVHEGRIRGFKVIESVRFSECDPVPIVSALRRIDDTRRNGQT